MITKTKKTPKLRNFICKICGSPFQNYLCPAAIAKGSGKVCSKACLLTLFGRIRLKTGKWLNCHICNKPKLVSGKNLRNKKSDVYTCIKCYKKVRILSTDGYWLIGHPRRKEHRVVMEQHLGRRLSINEIVHHKNGNKLDNRIENLIILTRREHLFIHPPQEHIARYAQMNPYLV